MCLLLPGLSSMAQELHYTVLFDFNRSEIPDTSLLREFIGGSNVLDYPIEELEEAEN